jgi:outer membrane protein assembly factor BamB
LVSGISQAGALGYVLDDTGRLHAFNLDDGQPAWESPVALGNWRVHQTVAVAQGWVIIGPTDPGNIPVADKAVLALDAATGKERWRRNLAVRHISDPLIAGDLVVVALSDGHAAALNLADGALRWREPVAGTGLAAPTLAGDLVIFGGDQGVLTARRIADGSLAWTFSVQESSTWGNSFPYSATFDAGTVYATCWNRRCYALDAETGALRWESEPTIKRPALSAPVLGENVLYFCGHDRYVYCLAADTGQRLWTRQFSRPAEIAPLLAGGALFVAAGDRCIYRLDPGSGELIGEAVLETAGKVEAPWSCDGQRIYVADKAGFVYALAVVQEQEGDDPAALEAQGRWIEAAAVHALAGDLLRAGDIYRDHVGSADKAAQLYERGGDLAQAAVQYAASGDLKTARRLYRETGQLLLAARLSEQLDDLVGAAQAYEACGQWADAGRIYEQLSAWPQAAGALEQAGDAAREAGDLPRAKAWWDRAAAAYQAAGQSEKAVQLYRDADQTAKAQAIVSSVADIALLRPLQRILLGPQRLARLLESEGLYVPAAEEYLRAEQPLEAARMYEAAGEYALASEHFQSQGYLLDAARTLALFGDHNAAAELYGQGGDFSQAAQAYAQAANHQQAALIFQQINAWSEAAGQWEALESWERAAEAWEQAGQQLSAASAWQRSGELLRAAECYCQAAEEMEQQSAADKETAAVYELAMQSYARCGADRRAADCDRKRRFLRKQPWLEATVEPEQALVADHRGKLIVTVTNSGWGNAEQVTIQATAWSDQEPVHSHARQFGLGRGISKAQGLTIIPHHPGRLALDVTIAYKDIHGNDYPLWEKTIDLDVEERGVARGVTPAEIHVHGDYFAEVRGEVISGVKIERRSGAGESPSMIAPVDVPAIECARCGHEERADAVACSQCQNPFVQCRHCRLSLPRRMNHCMHCGKPL